MGKGDSEESIRNGAPRVYVVAGPTAVGKGTVVRKLREGHPTLPLSVSATTRKPRDGEIHGVDYFFVSNAEFDDLIAQDALLEWATVHRNHRYGTPKQWVLEQGVDDGPVLLELDLEGARQVKRHLSDATTIFVAPPSWEELERRLLGRGTEDAQERQRRLETAKTELAAQDEFDVVVVNDDVERTVAALASVLGLD
mgnify:CR=1 FL=1